MDLPLHVTGLGAVTPVGLGAEPTGAAVRAGVNRFTEHPFHYGQVDETCTEDPTPLVCSRSTLLAPEAGAPDRILNLALHPLEEVFTRAGLGRADLAACGLFLAVSPEVEGVAEWGIERHLLREYFRRGALPRFAEARLFRQGHTGFFHALAAAGEALAEGRCRFALVGGVDSFLDEPSVRHFDAVGRLKSERNRDGFVPGEGAAYVLVEKAEDAAARRVPVLGVVDALAFGREERPLSGDRNATGRGLSEVFRRLAAPEEPARWVVGDLNGESYRGYEWGLVAARDAEIVRVPAGPWHPADCVGDLRAAGGALNLLVACRALHKGYAPAPGCIVYGADDGEGRAACRVRPAPAAA